MTPQQALDEILKLFEQYCSCDEYHIHTTNEKYGLVADSTTGNGHEDFDEDKAQQALQAWFLSTLDEVLPEKYLNAEKDYVDKGDYSKLVAEKAVNDTIETIKANAIKSMGGKE